MKKQRPRAWGKFDTEKYIYKKDLTSWKTNWISHCWHFRHEPTKMLEAGVYDGLTSIWFLDNVLVHPQSQWLGVDKRFHNSRENLKAAEIPESKIKFRKGQLEEILPELERNKETFDIIYWDATKKTDEIEPLLEQCWKLLELFGLLIIDDYGWTAKKSIELGNRSQISGVAEDQHHLYNPKEAIDRFLQRHKGSYDLFHKKFQVILAKTV